MGHPHDPVSPCFVREATIVTKAYVNVGGINGPHAGVATCQAAGLVDTTYDDCLLDAGSTASSSVYVAPAGDSTNTGTGTPFAIVSNDEINSGCVQNTVVPNAGHIYYVNLNSNGKTADCASATLTSGCICTDTSIVAGTAYEACTCPSPPSTPPSPPPSPPPPSHPPILPGSTKIGEVCTYAETWAVPANDAASIQVYLTMFGQYLFNISNTSLFNISITISSPAQYSSRQDPLGRRGLQQSEDIIVQDTGTQIPFTIPIPAPAPIDWRNEFDLATLYPSFLVPDPLSPYESQALYNSIDCSLEGREGLALDGDLLLHPTTLIRISMEFLTETDRGRQACLTMTTQNAMRDLLAPFGMTPCRDRSYICRPSLEIIPAPSPPPPDNWVRARASFSKMHPLHASSHMVVYSFFFLHR